MIFEQTAPIAVILVMLTSLVLLLDQKWRRILIALVVQYIGVFWLVATIWPVGLALVKLIVGWMAAAVISAAHPEVSINFSNEKNNPGRVFRILALGLVWTLVFSTETAFASWIPTSPAVLYGGLALFTAGLLQLGMSTSPLRVFLGLLTLLSGFEVFYSAIEGSVLVTGMLAVVNLGLALVGSYLIVSSVGEETV
jgi:hypothetical protein